MKQDIPANVERQTNLKKTQLELPKQQVKHNTDEKHLIGTFTSVLILGGFLLLSWFAVYWIYLSRI